MRQLGLFLIAFSLLLFILGLFLLLLPRFPRLPGDIVLRKGDFTVFIPLGTSLLLSLLLTLFLNLLFRGK